LRIFALGRTRVTSAESVLEGRWLANRPGQILKLLVTERHRRVFSDEIVERLWPDGTHDTRGLRNFVHALREHLEPQGAPSPPTSTCTGTCSSCCCAAGVAARRCDATSRCAVA